MKKPFYIPILICVFANSHIKAQELSLTKKEIKRAISRSKSIGNLVPHQWVACNQDSSYYKADTVVISSDYYGYLDMNCCEAKTFDFFRKRSFRMWETSICEEPTVVYVPADELTVRYKRKGKQLYLRMFNSRSTQFFEVISLKKKISSHFADKVVCYNLTLKRVRTV